MIISKASGEITLCGDTPIGVCTQVYPKEWFVRVNMFRFKFTLQGHAVNFCVKWNIPISRIYFRQDCQIAILHEGMRWLDATGVEHEYKGGFVK